MSAPVIEQDAPTSDVPANAQAIRFPVLAIEGLETADGRYLAPGSISHRALPLTVYAQIVTPSGGGGHDNSVIAGALTEMERVPGPEVISKSTGEPFPEGTYVWRGRGWAYTNVRFTPGGPTTFDMVKDRALSGNSIDLSDIIAEEEYEPGSEDDPGAQPIRLTMHQGVIGATTLVGQPAFPDAYVELDGELLVPAEGQTITAAAISWRSIELGDNCAACRAGQPLAVEQDVPEGEAPPARRDGMIALIPANADQLAVDGGDPAEEMHLTLAYLGDDVASWTPQQRDAVLNLGQSLADVTPPMEARVFAHAHFNPDGGPDGDREPCAVYLIGDGVSLANERDTLLELLRENLGEASMPEQHAPFVPHVTAGYGLGTDALSYTGPITFDRVRVALGGEITDYPLGGGEAIVAAALPVLPYAAFSVPEPGEYTAPYITEPDASGYRYYAGHIARWNVCHIGSPGKCITPPKSRSKYANFHLGLARTDQGDILAGVITFNRADQLRGGHADIRLSAADTVSHYDNTATVGADVVIVDGRHGPWACGVVRSDLTSADLHRLRMSMPSGDWRRVHGSLDLVGVLHVNTPGFSGARTLVASGEPMALVAGAVARGPVEDAAEEEGDLYSDGADLQVEPRPPYPAQEQLLAQIAELTGAPLNRRQFEAEVDLLLALDGEQLANWVEKAGGLPSFIKRITKHLEEKGMDESRAVATAVNAARKMCATGDTSLPGEQDVNAGSRAEACAAVAEWERKKSS